MPEVKIRASCVFHLGFFTVSVALQLDPLLVKVDNELILKCNCAFCKYIIFNFNYSEKVQNFSILVLQSYSSKKQTKKPNRKPPTKQNKNLSQTKPKRVKKYLFYSTYAHSVNIFR